MVYFQGKCLGFCRLFGCKKCFFVNVAVDIALFFSSVEIGVQSGVFLILNYFNFEKIQKDLGL